MANFEKSLSLVLKNEGIYSHDKDDRGEETYRGISRKYNPGWKGWQRIDDFKKDGMSDFYYKIEVDPLLKSMTGDFYKAKYWNKLYGDKISNQKLADDLFDQSVNIGVERTVEHLQRSLNLLNRDARTYGDINIDGIYGHNTMQSLNECLDSEPNNYKYLIKLINIFRGMRYIEYMENNSTQEKYARGWLNRINFSDCT